LLVKLNHNIQQVYRPFQPWAMHGVPDVTYREFLPSPLFGKYILCYWLLESTVPLAEHYDYGVVADGCIDVFYNLQNPEDSTVMGLSERFVSFELGNFFSYAGLRFRPAAFPHLFNIDASELTGKAEALKDIYPQFAQLICTEFKQRKAGIDIAALFDQCMMRLFQKIDPKTEDPRLHFAIERIFNASGNIRVEKDLDTGFSPRNLQRLFNFYIGAAPKVFSNIVRFQHMLQFCPKTKAIVPNTHFATAGYYDQAHFIKDFKRFYGKNPGEVF